MWVIIAWEHISPEVTEGFEEVLYIHSNGCNLWWYIVEW